MDWEEGEEEKDEEQQEKHAKDAAAKKKRKKRGGGAYGLNAGSWGVGAACLRCSGGKLLRTATCACVLRAPSLLCCGPLVPSPPVSF